MSYFRNPISQSIALVTLLLLAVSSNANTAHPYADPVSLGDYGIDAGAMLENAIASTHWTLTKESEELYFANLSYNNFDVTMRLTVVNNMLALTLDSVTATDCSSNCQDLGEKPVLRWSVSLRRRIMHELTMLIRDSL